MDNRIIDLTEEEINSNKLVFKIISKVFSYSYEMLREGVAKTPGRALRFFLPHPTKDNYSLYYDMEENTIEETYIVTRYEMGEYDWDTILVKYKVIITKENVAYVLRDGECLYCLDGKLKIGLKGNEHGKRKEENM